MMEEDNFKNEGKRYEMRKINGEQYLPSTEIKESAYTAEENPRLIDYLNVIVRRKWVFLLFFVSVVVSVALTSFMATSLYKASVTIRIDRENPNVLSFKDVYQPDTVESDYYQTQYKILKSRNIAKRVIKKIGLQNNLNFLKEINAPVSSKQKIKPSSTAQGASEQTEENDGISSNIVNAFIDRLEVQPLNKSQLVTVNFISRDPALAKTVANAVAETYIEFNINSKVSASQQAREWLQGQIDIMKDKVEAAEERLNEYSASNNMLFLEKSGKDDESMITRKLSELSAAISEATSDRTKKEAVYKEIKQSGAENPMVLDNPLIQELKKKHALLESEYYNLREIYKPDYPKMKSIESQIQAIQKTIEKEKHEIIKSLESDYNAAVKREKYLSGVLEAKKNEALDFQRKTVQYQILKREVDTNDELYNNLLQRLKEIVVSASLTSTNIQILDRAERPRLPFKPKRLLNILLSVIVGIMGGAGLAFFIEYIDSTVKDSRDIENRIKLPSLSLIPLKKPGDSLIPETMAYSERENLLSEAFRSVGTFISLSHESKPPKMIVVTSPGENEGKTTVSINTAITLAGIKGNGIIVDADLRRPRIHKIFGIGNTPGLSDLLSGNVEFDAGLLRASPINGLHALTSGKTPHNPSALLCSSKMKDILDALYALYEFVIIDSPPMLGMNESIYLSSFAEGVILVVKAGHTPIDAVMETKKILRNVNAKILGVVLNGIKENDLKRYGYYSYYHSSYYKQFR
jgi:capsular exopolysaccharide synthesis family protein